jgi:hypothetical protein
MKELKCYVVIGIIFVTLFGSAAHFIYGWTGKNPAAGLFFPVNESTWEHMKLVFFPMLIYAFYMNAKLKETYPCVTSSLCAGVLLSTVLIPVIFYTYTGFLGYHTLFLDILTFLVSVVLAFAAVYQYTLSCQMQPCESVLKAAVAVGMLLFFLFTYFPPGIGLFRDPVA